MALDDRDGVAANVPQPRAERAPWALAIAVLLLGAGLLAAVIDGAIGATRPPPPVPVAALTPQPAASVIEPSTGRRRYVANLAPAHRPAVVARPPAAQGTAASGSGTSGAGAAGPRASGSAGEAASGGDSGGTAASTRTSGLQQPVPAAWIAGFYPIYEEAQRTFGVNWLLIASIHRQETAFSTASSTYHGLNFAGCCGGPMQFNVVNGSSGALSTWQTVKDSYKDASRPAVYDHRTATHPSIYDDFDSIMAAAHLLSLDGAGYSLDDSAWWAAYDYYGHDEYGVTYADEVLARAIAWSQHGFCASCGTRASLLRAVHAAYGAPVLAELQAEAAKPSAAERARRRAQRMARARRAAAGRRGHAKAALRKRRPA